MEKLFKNEYRTQSTRLSFWNYSNNGYYFVTICTNNRINFFGAIKNKKIYLSKIGKMAKKCWQDIPKHFSSVVLDEYIIMPNHVHGILIINNGLNGNVEAQNFAPLRDKYKNKFGPQSKNLSSIIRGFKIGVKKYSTINNINFDWQERFYDHAIREHESIYNIQQYIITNPERWSCDRNNIKNLKFEIKK